MKRSPYVLSLILIFTLVCNAQKNQLYVPGEVLMKLKNPEIHALSYVGERISSGVELLDRYLATQGLKAFNNIFQPTSDLRGYYKLAFPKEVDVAEICKNLRLIAAVEYATLNYYAELSSDPDDPLWSAQWQGTKQQFREAWDITRGSPAVLVGVMDSGLDINHPDISPNKHPSLHWDLVDDDNDPSEVPPSNHGTRVGGVISARSNNGIGLAGYAGGWQGVQGCSVVGLRVGGYNPESGLDEITQERAAAALDYARQNGIKVVNMSFNFYQRTDPELSIFKAAIDGANGIVVMVAASGNGFKNTDEVHPNDPLPAPARWNGVIAVGAATYGSSPSAELRWTGSNYDAIDEKLSVVTSVGEPGG